MRQSRQIETFPEMIAGSSIVMASIGSKQARIDSNLQILIDSINICMGRILLFSLLLAGMHICEY